MTSNIFISLDCNYVFIFSFLLNPKNKNVLKINYHLPFRVPGGLVNSFVQATSTSAVREKMSFDVCWRPPFIVIRKTVFYIVAKYETAADDYIMYYTCVFTLTVYTSFCRVMSQCFKQLLVSKHFNVLNSSLRVINVDIAFSDQNEYDILH